MHFPTRLDWNLLSTVTPAMNAWMNPFDRLMKAIRHVNLALAHRTSSVMACVMTEALELPGIQLPYKVRRHSATKNICKHLLCYVYQNPIALLNDWPGTLVRLA